MKLVSGNQIKSLTLNQLITEFAGSMDRQIKTAIQAGVIEGRTVQELAREVGGLVNTRSRRQAETLVDRKSTRLNSSHVRISYAVFCLKKKKKQNKQEKNQRAENEE